MDLHGCATEGCAAEVPPLSYNVDGFVLFFFVVFMFCLGSSSSKSSDLRSLVRAERNQLFGAIVLCLCVFIQMLL